MSYHPTGQSGLEWPHGSGLTAVFHSGPWVGGIVNNDIRIAACEYLSEYVPGPWGSNSDSAEYRIYTIRGNDDPSNPDWQNWPVNDGAPWTDVDGDGVYDPNVDHPNIIGDLFQWYVMNDGDQAAHNQLFGSNPLGLEVQVSLFGFDSVDVLENTYFIKWLIINKRNVPLDSVFFAAWSDPDLGDANDDFVGCDTILNLGYTYNDGSDDVYGNQPPAVGYTFLQPPIVPSPGDTAWVSGEPIPDYRNLKMTAFLSFVRGDYAGPEHPHEIYRLLNGLRSIDGANYYDPTTGLPTTYYATGNPVTGSGWLDSLMFPSGDRRFLMSSGPFDMAPGDSQEVVMAITVSQGANEIASVAALKDDSRWIRSTWNSNFTKLGPVCSITELYAPHNTESTGPFTFQFEIADNPGWGSVTKKFHYSINGVGDSIVFTETGSDLYILNLPNSSVTGTTSLHYWISVLATDGSRMTWPSGAPFNYHTLIFGPDTTSPVLTNLSDVRKVHYQLTFQRTVTATIVDDRFGVTPTLKWYKQNDDQIYEALMILEDTVNHVYSGLIQPFDMNPAYLDTIFYWIYVIDSSQNQNNTLSETKWFSADNEVAIGEWEDLRDDSWDLWNHGSVVTDPNLSGPGKILRLNPIPVGGADTLTFLNTLNLAGFQVAGLTFPTVYVLYTGENFGYFEVSPDGTHWDRLRTFTGFPPPHEVQISLMDYLGVDSLRLRFRSVRNSDGAHVWILGDVYFHSDSSRLEIRKQNPIPQQFDLSQNYPNPFNVSTRFKISIPREEQVRLTIYDLLGREVAVLLDKALPPGVKELNWDASQVASGIYFYRLETPGRTFTRKMAVVK